MDGKLPYLASDVCCVPRVVWLGVSRWVDLLDVWARQAALNWAICLRETRDEPASFSFSRHKDIENGASEIDRIRAEYARRKRDIPQSFYSWDRVSNCFTHTQLVRDCIAELTRAKMFPLESRSVADIGCGSGTWLLGGCTNGGGKRPSRGLT